MTSSLSSLPLWMQFLAGFVLLGLGLVFILMPFSIFGVKPRLEEVELQLGEIRAELRVIALRLARDGHEVGPSGEPVFVPPRRAAPASAASAATPDPAPWSSAARRSEPLQPDVVAPRPAPSPAPQPRDVRDDYRYEDRPAPDSVDRILRPTHFEPPPPREAPRQHIPDVGVSADKGDEERWRLQKLDRASSSARSHDERFRSEQSYERREMSPRAAAEDAERRRLAEEDGYRRPRSEPTLRWPPRT